MCVIYRKDYLILIGGDESREQVTEVEGTQTEQDSQDLPSNTVYRLNLKTNSMVVIPQNPDTAEFKPRLAHSGVIYQDMIYVFGGLERNKQFNSQFHRMEIRRKDSEDKRHEERHEKNLDHKSIISDTKSNSKCKFCDTRQVGAYPPQGSAHLVRRVWEDHSPLENKIKRRLS